MTHLRWRAVLFDLDGTLANTIPLIVGSYRVALSSSQRILDEDMIRGWIGRTLVDVFTELEPGRVGELVDAYTTWNLANLERLIEPYPGVAELLGDLAGAGATTAVVTSKRRNSAERSLAAVGLDGLVPLAVTMGETDRHKPAPDPLLFALDALGLAASETVYVGDAVVDLAAARAAGVAGIGVTWGAGSARDLRGHPAVAVVDTVPDLRTLLLG